MDLKEQAYRRTVEDHLRQQSDPDLGLAIENAREYFQVLGALDSELLDKVGRDLASELQERIRQIKDPYILSQSHDTSWYDEEKHEGIHWPALSAYLHKSKGWSEEVVGSISKSSRDVVAQLGDPGTSEFDVRGLVVGYVQSGKTANMTAVISRAVDAGYNMIVVLAGTTDKLRHQTQERVESDLISRNQYNWQQLTTCNEYSSDGSLIESGDYRGQVSKKLPNIAPSVAMIAVTKKLSALLQRLIVDIKNTPAIQRNKLRMLVIDDEADQASPNSGKCDEDPTITNRRIRELLNSIPSVSYIGYTATPFANVLINPFPQNVKDEDESNLEDLYPRSFVVSLPKPDGYFGAEQIFGRDPVDAEDDGGDGLSVIRDISKNELSNIHPGEGGMRLDDIPTLRAAIRWFLLVVAVRICRGQSDKHTSMLVHTSHKIDDHEAIYPLIKQEVDFLKENIGAPDLLQILKDAWEDESSKVPAEEFGNDFIDFETLASFLSVAVERISIAVENSQSAERLSYEKPSSAIIAIGGNILARGLTLEGLAVTYFTRNSRQYDTLLQMGRWFGYRVGYEDLVRLWLPKSVSSAFRQLASVEHELRLEIEEYAYRKAKPIDFAVRIKTLPGLQVTARNKMRHANTANIDYRGLHLQTIRFPREDVDSLKKNWAAGSALASKAGISPRKFVGEVGVNAVVEFFREYVVHTSHRDLTSNWLEEYIRINSDVLNVWSVVVVQPADQLRPLADEALGGAVPKLVRRSRLEDTDPAVADIKALMSRADVMADVSEDLLPTKGDWKSWDWSRLKSKREELIGARPMLLLYPIDKKSIPAKTSKESKRTSLDASNDVLGVGIVFPQLGVKANSKPTKYIEVSLKGSFFHSSEDDLAEF